MVFARNARDNPGKYSSHSIATPAVVGAVIDLGHCMNLMDAIHIERLAIAYDELKALTEIAGSEMPTNRGKDDRPLRELDRAVIETLHNYMKTRSREFQPYDTVRGLFLEGSEIYPGAGFKRETHIQICVRNVNCIKAYFDPRNEVANPFSML